MSDSDNGTGSTGTATIDDQWSGDDAPHSPECVHFRSQEMRAGNAPKVTGWNWVMIAVMVCSLAWYISKLPETLGLH